MIQVGIRHHLSARFYKRLPGIIQVTRGKPRLMTIESPHDEGPILAEPRSAAMQESLVESPLETWNPFFDPDIVIAFVHLILK